MALEGSLREFGLTDILQLIYFQKKSGILTLSGHADKVKITFYEGNIISLESRKRADEARIGKVLVKKGLISEGDLATAIEEQKKSGSRIGDALVRLGLVIKDTISEMITSQMTEAVVQLFSWKDGIYKFDQQAIALSKDLPIMLNTEHLLMDGLRKIDEWSQVKGKITLDTIFDKTGRTGVSLNPDEESLMKFIDGENDASIIINLSGIDDFQASKVLLSLMEKGVIAIIEAPRVATEVTITPPKAGYKSFFRFLPMGVLLISIILSVITLTVIIFKGDSFNSLMAVKDVDKLRFMAEVYKHRNGNYPPDLNQLGNTNDRWGRPYIYMLENEGIVILSAGPDGKSGTKDDIY